MKTMLHILGYTTTAFIALVLGAAFMAASASDTSSSPAETVTSTATTTATDPGSTTTTTAAPTTTTETETATVTADPPPPEAAIPGDGTFEVGVDIEPGTYVSEAPPGGGCYWARLSGAGGMENIIDNSISDGQSIVTIQESDEFFETSRCGEWVMR